MPEGAQEMEDTRQGNRRYLSAFYVNGYKLWEITFPGQGAGEGWNSQWHTGEQALGRGCANPQPLHPLPSAGQAAGQAQAMLVQEVGSRRLGTFSRGMMAHPGVSWRGLHKPLCQNKFLTPAGAMVHTASLRRLAPENCGDRSTRSPDEPSSRFQQPPSYQGHPITQHPEPPTLSIVPRLSG